MTVRAGLFLLMMGAALVGCGNERSNEIGDSIVGQMAKGVIEARRGAKPAPEIGVGGPAIQATFANLGLDLRMVPLDRDGDVTIWHDGQGHQLATRNGLLIWTRGFGADLMSASVPKPSAIRPGAQYPRLNTYVDGADRRYERRYECLVEIPETPDTTTPGRHLREVCTGPLGKVRNEYWMRGSQMVRSKQWVSSTFGHVEILPQ